MIKYPMKLSSVPKNIIWGGTRLAERYNKSAPFEKIAESWELTVRDDGVSVILNGEYAGKSLKALLREDPSATGDRCLSSNFPLLIKFIDACDDLSIQVHPDDNYAARFESDGGKSEMWYVVECDENAELIYGFRNGCSSDPKKLLLGNVADCLKRVKIKKGDVFFIPAGQVHAICKGALIAEIQQNSNVTYRIYDYDRTDTEGKKRELHIAKALDTVKVFTDDEILSLRFKGSPQRRPPISGGEVLCDCEYFRVTKFCLSGKLQIAVDATSFAALLFTDAEAATVSYTDTELSVSRGECVFIPAGCGLITVSGEAELLLSEI